MAFESAQSRIARPAKSRRNRRVGLTEGGARFVAIAGFKQFSDGYTWFVGFLKLALPTIAVVLVGMVLMWPQIKSAEEALSKTVVGSLRLDEVENLQMIQARYVGTDDQNRPFVLTAAGALANLLGLTPREIAWTAWAAAADAADEAVVDARGPAAAERPEEVRTILAHRHERVDGAGTPQGLVGDEIALGARILAVVAAFEAATQGGSAGGRTTPAEAIEELRQGAGRMFDPIVVETFVLLMVEEGWLDRGWALGPPDAANAA